MFYFQNNALDEADGIKKKVETVVVEVAAKSLISGSWNKVGKSLSVSIVHNLACKPISTNHFDRTLLLQHIVYYQPKTS
jgi:hypothetical protein